MGDEQKLVELFTQLNGADNTARNTAEAALKEARTKTPGTTCGLFVKVIASAQVSLENRIYGATLFRRMCNPHAQTYVLDKLSENERKEVKDVMLNLCLNEEQEMIIRSVAEVIKVLAKDSGAWPELLQKLFEMFQKTTAVHREYALDILAGMVDVQKKMLLSKSADVGQLLTRAFQDTSKPVRAAAVDFVCEMAQAYKKDEWGPLQALWPSIIDASKFCIDDQESFSRILNCLSDTASFQAGFFRSHLRDIITFVGQIIMAKDNVDQGVRAQALEIPLCLAEAKPKMVAKVDNFVTDLSQVLLHMLTEIEEDEDWPKNLDEEDEDVPEDSAYGAAEMGIDRLVLYLGAENSVMPFLSVVEQWKDKQDWKEKVAFLVGIRQCVEYFEEDEHVQQFTEWALAYTSDPHMRVRYMAWYTLGQISTDQKPRVQELMSSKVLPALATGLDEREPRVLAMCMSSLYCFVENVDETDLMEFADTYMHKCAAIMKVPNVHRVVMEEALTSIAAIAGVMDKNFTVYYNEVMPVIKEVVKHCGGEKEKRLRGKAFECMSVLGLAVGKKMFMPDAIQCLDAIFSICQTATDDGNERGYLTDAIERIVSTLKEDFAQFLPSLLPQMLQACKIPQEEDTRPQNDEDDETDDIIRLIKGKRIRIRSSEFDDMAVQIRLLGVIAEETGPGFLPFVESVAEVLQEVLAAPDELRDELYEVRVELYRVWATLIKCASQNGKQPVACRLTHTFIGKSIDMMMDEEDHEVVMDNANGITTCLENSGHGKAILSDADNEALMNHIFRKLEESFTRKREEAEDEEDEDDEDGIFCDDDDDITEHDCCVQLTSIFGAMMASNPEGFFKVVVPKLQTPLVTWLGSADVEEYVLGLFIVADFLEKLKERSVPAWPSFLNAIVKSLTHKDPRVRTAGAYAANLASRLPAFHANPAGKQVFAIVVDVLQQPQPKRRAVKDMLAYDNMVAALLNFLIHMPQNAPKPEMVPQLWDAVFQKLPLNEDTVEAKKVHEDLCDRLERQEPGLLGANNERAGKVLGLLVDQMTNEEYVSEEVRGRIRKLVLEAPVSMFQQLKTQFSDRQMKKIQNIKTAGS